MRIPGFTVMVNPEEGWVVRNMELTDTRSLSVP